MHDTQRAPRDGKARCTIHDAHTRAHDRHAPCRREGKESASKTSDERKSLRAPGTEIASSLLRLFAFVVLCVSLSLCYRRLLSSSLVVVRRSLARLFGPHVACRSRALFTRHHELPHSPGAARSDSSQAPGPHAHRHVASAGARHPTIVGQRRCGARDACACCCSSAHGTLGQRRQLLGFQRLGFLQRHQRCSVPTGQCQRRIRCW